jgi:hypothetical protein
VFQQFKGLSRSRISDYLPQSRKVSEKKYSELGVLGALARDTLSAIQ